MWGVLMGCPRKPHCKHFRSQHGHHYCTGLFLVSENSARYALHSHSSLAKRLFYYRWDPQLGQCVPFPHTNLYVTGSSFKNWRLSLGCCLGLRCRTNLTVCVTFLVSARQNGTQGAQAGRTCRWVSGSNTICWRGERLWVEAGDVVPSASARL